MMAVVPLVVRAQAVVQAHASPVPSPCVCICTMNAKTGLCDGCLRSLDEIAAWSRMGDPGKRAVWALIAERCTAAGVTL